MATACAFSPVFLPRMISTSIILSTGEKKWMPMKFFGRAEFFASPVIGMVEVLDAKIADGLMIASAFSVTPFLTSESSNTASMTRSQPSSCA